MRGQTDPNLPKEKYCEKQPEGLIFGYCSARAKCPERGYCGSVAKKVRKGSAKVLSQPCLLALGSHVRQR